MRLRPVPAVLAALCALGLAGALVWSLVGGGGDRVIDATGVYADPQGAVARAVARQRDLTAAERAALRRITDRPMASWLTGDAAQSVATVHRVLAAAAPTGAVPVMVLYRVPHRDCGSASALSTAWTADDYRRWVAAIAAAIGRSRPLVVVEPDALAQLDCLTADQRHQRIALLRAATRALGATGARVYLDAGHAGWTPAAEMGRRLTEAGGGGAVGFSLNVSAFGSTAAEIAYGRAISRLTGGAHFVVDTSRNGARVPAHVWCNPPEARLGAPPTLMTPDPLVDALLWVKSPGLSDGGCAGAPAAGVLWPEGALRLAGG